MPPDKTGRPRFDGGGTALHEEKTAGCGASKRWHDGCVIEAIPTLAPASGAPEATNRTETETMNFPALRTTQKQLHTVTPRLQHAVRLLQLSSLDFAQEVHDAMGRNPFLEVDESADTPAAGDDGGNAAATATTAATVETVATAPEADATWERESWQSTGGSGSSTS